MTKAYDWSKARRGQVIPTPGKTRITIRIDDDVLEWFREQIRRASRGSYQTLMNDALRAHMQSKEGHAEAMVRKVIREELAEYTVKKKTR